VTLILRFRPAPNLHSQILACFFLAVGRGERKGGGRGKRYFMTNPYPPPKREQRDDAEGPALERGYRQLLDLRNGREKRGGGKGKKGGEPTLARLPPTLPGRDGQGMREGGGSSCSSFGLPSPSPARRYPTGGRKERRRKGERPSSSISLSFPSLYLAVRGERKGEKGGRTPFRRRGQPLLRVHCRRGGNREEGGRKKASARRRLPRRAVIIVRIVERSKRGRGKKAPRSLRGSRAMTREREKGGKGKGAPISFYILDHSRRAG